MGAGRAELARALLELEVATSIERASIDLLRGELRKRALTAGAYTEQVGDRGSVIVTGGTPAKFKGLVPVLDAELFLAAEEEERARLTGAGIVRMDEKRTKASAPSVTVKLAGQG